MRGIVIFVVFIVLLISTFSALSQQTFPYFLAGTWKMENGNIFEHWDIISDENMKGFSYKMSENKIKVSEYLEISSTKGNIIYTAVVLNQNNGKGIEFILTQSDSVFVFENPEHDFPQKISYLKRSATEIFVTISGNIKGAFTYTLHKIVE